MIIDSKNGDDSMQPALNTSRQLVTQPIQRSPLRRPLALQHAHRYQRTPSHRPWASKRNRSERAHSLPHQHRSEDMVIDSEGMIIDSEDMIIDPEGMVIDPEGMDIDPEGMVIDSEGMAIDSEGIIFGSEDLIQSNTGQMTEEMVIEPDNRYDLDRYSNIEPLSPIPSQPVTRPRQRFRLGTPLRRPRVRQNNVSPQDQGTFHSEDEVMEDVDTVVREMQDRRQTRRLTRAQLHDIQRRGARLDRQRCRSFDSDPHLQFSASSQIALISSQELATSNNRQSEDQFETIELSPDTLPTAGDANIPEYMDPSDMSSGSSKEEIIIARDTGQTSPSEDFVRRKRVRRRRRTPLAHPEFAGRILQYIGPASSSTRQIEQGNLSQELTLTQRRTSVGLVRAHQEVNPPISIDRVDRRRRTPLASPELASRQQNPQPDTSSNPSTMPSITGNSYYIQPQGNPGVDQSLISSRNNSIHSNQPSPTRQELLRTPSREIVRRQVQQVMPRTTSRSLTSRQTQDQHHPSLERLEETAPSHSSLSTGIIRSPSRPRQVFAIQRLSRHPTTTSSEIGVEQASKSRELVQYSGQMNQSSTSRIVEQVVVSYQDTEEVQPKPPSASPETVSLDPDQPESPRSKHPYDEEGEEEEEEL
jgi:hypothetical protein